MKHSLLLFTYFFLNKLPGVIIISIIIKGDFMDKSNIEAFLERYEDAKDIALRKIHIIKKSNEYIDTASDLYIYTDGSSKGSVQSTDYKSFSGWGVYTREQFSNGKTTESVCSGNLFNSNINQAELKAVHSALNNLRTQARLHFVCDSAYVIRGLRDIHLKLEQKKIIEQTPVEERKKWQWKELRMLNMWHEIHDLITSSKVLSLDVHWMRSHTVDKEEDLPLLSEARNPRERQLVEDCIGNFYADQQANLGARKAVRGALWFLKNEPNEEKVLRSIPTCSKNFSNSHFSREEAVNYLGKQEPDFLPRHILLAILDSFTLERLDAIFIEKQKQKQYQQEQVLKKEIEEQAKQEQSAIFDFEHKENGKEKFYKKYAGRKLFGMSRSQ
jgi:Ribonuclease HI